jgi:hypothetical protein
LSSQEINWEPCYRKQRKSLSVPDKGYLNGKGIDDLVWHLDKESNAMQGGRLIDYLTTPVVSRSAYC